MRVRRNANGGKRTGKGREGGLEGRPGVGGILYGLVLVEVRVKTGVGFGISIGELDQNQ